MKERRKRKQTDRWTRAKLETLDAQILAVLKADNPQSVRHVFYRMTDPRLAAAVEKTENGYDRVQRRCLLLRQCGRLPYGWITDTTRRGYHVSTFDGAGEFIERFAGLYRAALWTPREPLVEVWAESRSLAGVLQRECQRLAVSLYPSAGFASETLCYEAAQEIDAAGRDRAIILYIGDHDPAGVLIDKDIAAKLASHAATPIELHRLAINEAQIAAYGLPTKPRKDSDKRRPDIQETVEAEAMPAGELRRIVREAVESYLPPGALHVAKAAEESEREGLRMLAGDIREYGLETFL